MTWPELAEGERKLAERKGFDAANDGEAVVAPLKPASPP